MFSMHALIDQAATLGAQGPLHSSRLRFRRRALGRRLAM